MPILALATITAVAGVVKTLVSIGQAISSVRKAPDEAKELLRVVRSLQHLVSQVHTDTERQLASLGGGGGEIWEQSLTEITSGIKDTVERLKALGVNKRSMKIGQRFQWTLSADTTKRYTEYLNQFTSQINTLQLSLVGYVF
jgi:hypothetical protein